jgi:hypothetical protein
MLNYGKHKPIDKFMALSLKLLCQGLAKSYKVDFWR